MSINFSQNVDFSDDLCYNKMYICTEDIMENVKYRIPFILFVSTLAAALVLMIVSLGGTASLSGTAYADVTSPDEINVILDEAKSKESGAAVAYALPASVDYGSGVALPTPRLKYEGEPAAKIIASV